MMIATIFHEIICYGGVIALPLSYQTAGWIGVLTHISTISVGTIVLDFKLSSTASNNVRRITEEYKVSKYTVYSLMAMNLYMANITTIWLLLYFDAIDTPSPLFNIYEVLRVVGSVALYLLATEIMFTAGHAWLHHTKWGREIHTLHHLCKPASLSSNLLFHPIDMMVEFGGPFLSLILMHVYIFQDPFIFKTAMTILNIWYSADHDENLGLSHLHHHKEMGPTILTIYGRYEWFERLVANEKKKAH